MRRFAHEAMATTFEVIVVEEDAEYARQAAKAAFDEVDRLEKELSRYIENSDISRINSVAAGEPVVVGLDSFACLRLGVDLYHETHGLFDITIGSLLGCWRDDDGEPRTPTDDEISVALSLTGADKIHLYESEHAVVLATAPLLIDLGGIGKGYAVDSMAQLLRDWSIDTALIHGGYSSVLALDAPPGMDGWPLTFTHPQSRQVIARLCLCNRAVSGSGVQKGGHIINPKTAKPVKARVAAWSSTPDAGTGDALSTTFMMMSLEQIEGFCRKYPEVMAAVIPHGEDGDASGEELIQFGNWEGVASFE
jgi:thiamine biosynthesis lipoprotein